VSETEHADVVLALPALRAVRDDTLRRDLAALAEAYDDGRLWSSQVVDRIRSLLDGGEGGR